MILVSFILVVLLNLYLLLIGSYQKQLHDLAKASEIKCSISNINGSMSVGLSISGRVIRALQESEYVKDMDCSVLIKGGLGEFDIDTDWAEKMNLYGRAISTGKSSILPSGTTIDYLSGWDGTLFEGSDHVCVMKKSIMQEQDISYGDDVVFTLFYNIYDSGSLEVYTEKLGTVQVKIVGQIDDTYTESCPAMLFPFQMIWDEFEKRQLDFTADAVSFHIKDPLQINEFKEEMKSLGFAEINRDSMMSYSGSALYVQDGTFIALASQLKTAIQILTAFLAPICVLLLIVGYVISYLLCNGRVKEFALLRMLGAGQAGVVTRFWMEQFILVLSGIVLGNIVMLWWQDSLKSMLAVTAFVLFGYMAGTGAALILTARKTPMQLLITE